MISKEIAKQALDVLASHDAEDFGHGAEVMQALRAAIDQPEPYDQQALEPCGVCGWKTIIPGEPCLMCERNAKMLQPESEPVCVARIEVMGKDWRLDYLSLPVGMHNLYAQTYTYASPQVADYVPLTDPQIYAIAKQHPRIATLVPHLEVGEFARAIEKVVQQTYYEADLLTIAYLDGVHAGKKTNCVPLSDEQIAEISVECAVTTPSDFYFARAIERAVRGGK